ncbi:MAG TPA: response regulator transcription factor [Marmoricola sp.]|nr:response regulator transcription factor [Marmoricola sp.]HNO39813.1 response regulator transcription factor [Marmoricola sp.]
MGVEVLVVEDHPDIAYPLTRTLEREGYGVTWVENGRDAIDHLSGNDIDLIILDLGLPDMDGLDVCKAARAGGFAGGIMICSARGDELDRVVGLDYGADDYLPKPFGLAELQARARALLRRTANNTPAEEESLLRVDESSRRASYGDVELNLTHKEFDVLALLAESQDKVVSRERLMSEVWDENWFGSTKTLDVTIGRLRQKLEAVGDQVRVVTLRGVGFRLETGPNPKR